MTQPPAAAAGNPTRLCGNRIVITGTTGSGKSTLAARLAAARGMPWVELDSLRFRENWEQTTDAEFRAAADERLSGDRWVADGNYTLLQDIVWGRAETLIWLDYAFSVNAVRLLKRTVRRIVTQEPLWHGNRESLKMALSRESILLWLLRSYSRRRRLMPGRLADPRWTHLQVLRFHTPRETERWLESILLQRTSATRDLIDNAESDVGGQPDAVQRFSGHHRRL